MRLVTRTLPYLASPATADGALCRQARIDIQPFRAGSVARQSVERIARSADCAAKARTATTADIRNALDRLAARYAVLAAQWMPAKAASASWSVMRIAARARATLPSRRIVVARSFIEPLMCNSSQGIARMKKIR